MEKLQWEISADASAEVNLQQAILLDLKTNTTLTTIEKDLWKMVAELRIMAIVNEDKLEWCYEQLRG